MPEARGWLARGTLLSVVRRWLGPIGSIVLLGYLLRDVDLDATLEATRDANLPLAVACVVLPQCLAWLLVSLLMQRSVTWFGGQLAFRDMFWVRGASYLLMLLNSSLGQGSLLLYQRGVTGLGWAHLLGIVVARLSVSICILVLLQWPIVLGALWSGRAEPLAIPLTAVWVALGVTAYLLLEVGLTLFGQRRFGVSAALLRRFEQAEFLFAWRQLRPTHAFRIAVLFLPQIGSTLLGYFALSHAFGVTVPWREFVLLGPLLLVLLDLPIAFSGFGTATMAWVALFGTYGSLEQLTALTLFLPSARLLTRMTIGAVSLPLALPRFRAAGLRWKRDPRDPAPPKRVL